MKDYQIIYNNKNWVINNKNNNYVLSSQDYKSYNKTWTTNLRDNLIKPNSSVLLINDGEQIFYNALVGPLNVTIVDPDCYEFCEKDLSEPLNTTPFKNIKDSLGYTHKLTLIDLSFKEAFFDECFKSKFNHICINAKSSEDLSVENIEKYFLLLEDFGCIFVQVSSDLYTESMKLHLDHYFSLLNTKYRLSFSKNKIQIFNSYIKISNLV